MLVRRGREYLLIHIHTVTNICTKTNMSVCWISLCLEVYNQCFLYLLYGTTSTFCTCFMVQPVLSVPALWYNLYFLYLLYGTTSTFCTCFMVQPVLSVPAVWYNQYFLYLLYGTTSTFCTCCMVQPVLCVPAFLNSHAN